MYLGIDIGTSGVKAVAMAEDGQVIAQASAPLSSAHPHPLWSEQNPDDWWQATESAVLALDPALRAKVQAIGLAGQMHGATLLDAQDRVLRPAILWNDGRAAAECAAFEQAAPQSRVITGNPAMAGFTAPKLLWLRRHEPACFEAIRTVLLPKDYVRLHLTGDMATDMSDASGTLWLDIGKRCWSPELLDACGLDDRMMPRLHEGPMVTGILRPVIAARFGMGRVPVAAGGGDNAAAAVGLGVIGAGDAFLSLGTSGVLFAATECFQPHPAAAVHAFAHALPDRWHQMAVMLSAAACLDWAARLLDVAGAPAVLALAEQAPDSGDVTFLPYLTGERTPHGDAEAQGVLIGMTGSTGQPQVARAVLEGVAMGLKDGLDALIDAGSAVDVIRMAGGGSRSPFWGRLIAAALDRPLAFSAEGAVGPAHGAARLARLAISGESIETVCTAPPVTMMIMPEADLAAGFAAHQPRFRGLYQALKGHFRAQ